MEEEVVALLFEVFSDGGVLVPRVVPFEALCSNVQSDLRVDEARREQAFELVVHGLFHRRHLGTEDRLSVVIVLVCEEVGDGKRRGGT